MLSFVRSSNVSAWLLGLLDSAMDAIITVDAEQRIVLYNGAASQIFGFAPEQVLGQSLAMLIPERFREGHAAHMKRFGATGVTSRRMGLRSVVQGRRANGEVFPIDASISHFETPEGQLFTVILRDVSELANLATQAAILREQEKTRVARELHDELAQSLTALKMDAIWLRDHLAGDPAAARAKLSGMLAMIDDSVAATRRIAADLRPLVLDDLGLAAAIEWLSQNFTQRTGVACRLAVDEEMELHEPYASAVFRIVQESLVNVGKHAHATEVEVTVERTPGEVRLSVRDNGGGFDTSARRHHQSLGLVGLRERAQLLKGQVAIHSVVGQGTRVEAHIPVHEPEPEP